MNTHIDGCPCSLCNNSSAAQQSTGNLGIGGNATTAYMCKCGKPLCAGVLCNPALQQYHCTCTTGFCAFHSSNQYIGPGRGSLFQQTYAFEPLSPEEAKELDQLTTQHRAETKQLKLNAFKELPAPLRQHVINTIVWHNKCAEISEKVADKSQRLQELESRPYSINFGKGLWLENATYLHSIMPTDLTLEDLEQAHNDATLEECIGDE